MPMFELSKKNQIEKRSCLKIVQVNAALLKQHDSAVPPYSDKSFAGEGRHGLSFVKANMLIRYVFCF
jgi:hypothetical protein